MDPEPTSAEELTRSFELLREGLGLLNLWRATPSFRARVVSQGTKDEPERDFDLIAEPAWLRYQLTDVASGSVSSFDGTTNALVIDGEPSEYSANVIGFEPMEVRLAFPANLGIWGNALGNYRIVGGREIAAGQYPEDPHIQPGDIEILLSLSRAPQLSGSLVISRRQRMAVRLDTPIQTLWYRRIGPK